MTRKVLKSIGFLQRTYEDSYKTMYIKPLNALPQGQGL